MPPFWKRYVQAIFVPDPYIVRWLPKALLQGRALIREVAFDAILSSSPVDTCHLIALDLSRRLKKPWIVDFRDPWVRNPFVALRPAWADSLNQRLEARVVRAATLITCTSPVHLDALQRRYPDCTDKFKLLLNGFDPHDLVDIEPIRPSQPAFSLVHTGTFYGLRTPLLLFEALTRLPADIHLELVGGSCKEVNTLIQHYRLAERVRATPVQPHKVALGWCLGADLQILIPGSHYAIPGKLYEYAATGRPILHIGPDNSAAAQLLAQWGIGCSAETVLDLIAAILRARREANSGLTPPRIDLTRYSRPHLTGELVRHLTLLTEVTQPL
jgi:hypothetical protein